MVEIEKFFGPQFIYGEKGAKTTTELCPPKPNEFEIAA